MIGRELSMITIRQDSPSFCFEPGRGEDMVDYIRSLQLFSKSIKGSVVVVTQFGFAVRVF